LRGRRKGSFIGEREDNISINQIGVNMNTMAEAETQTQVFIETLRRVDTEIESAIETLEIMSNNETLKAIEEGLQDIKNGRVIKFEDFLKKHEYEI
jgi:predicted transcriptional regulator